MHEVVEPGAVAARVLALAATLSSRARISQVGAKELIRRSAAGEFTVDADVQALYEQSWASPEYAEGVAAFLGKRAPEFRAARQSR